MTCSRARTFRSLSRPSAPNVCFMELMRLTVSSAWPSGKKRSAAGVSRHSLAGRPRSEEHTSELQSLMRNSYDVFCLKTKQTQITTHNTNNTKNSCDTTKKIIQEHLI